MIEVEAPDGTIVEFPAGTSRDVMRGAMQRRFGQPQQRPAPLGDWQPDVEVTTTAAAPSGGADLPLPPPSPPVPASAGRSFMQGLTDPIQGGAQLLVNSLPAGLVSGVNRAAEAVNNAPYIGPVTRALGMTPATPQQITDQTVRREDAYAAERGASGNGIDWMRGVGQVAASVPAAVALPTGASILGSVGAGAATGAGMSALQPVDNPGANYWDEKIGQATTGGMIGGATGPVGYIAGRMIAPNIDPNVRALNQAGVQMTPGQMMGGLARRLESGVRGLPFIGEPIAGAQRRGLESLNRTVAGRVLAPLGETIPDGAPVGREMVRHVQERVSNAYQTALPRLTPFGPDQQFAQDATQAAQSFMTPQSRQVFNNFLRDKIFSRMQSGPIDGATYQTVRSELGTEATTYLSSTNAADKEIGRGLVRLQEAIDALMVRANPASSQPVMAANEAYSLLQRLNGAAGMQGAVDGVFNPTQLQAAVRQQDRSGQHRAFARGDARMQDLSDAARAALPDTVPDSGTGFRNALMGATGGAAAGVIPPELAVALGGTAAAYSEPVRRVLTEFLMSNRPYSARVVGSALANSGGAVATPLAASMLAPPRPASRP